VEAGSKLKETIVPIVDGIDYVKEVGNDEKR
jgi:hypothetical protein